MRLHPNLSCVLTVFAVALMGCNTTSTTPAATGMSVQEARSLSNDPIAQSRDTERSQSFDFKASVTAGPNQGTALEGKLGVELKSWKDETKVFVGGLVTSSARYPARGVLLPDGRIFVFLEIDAKADAWIVAQGKSTATGGFEGTFDGPKLGQDSGSWAAAPSATTTPPPVGATALAYDFSARVESGPDKGSSISGKLEIIIEGLDGMKPADVTPDGKPVDRPRAFRKFAGTLTLKDGTKVPVKGTVLCAQRVLAVFKLAADSSKLIFGEGAIQMDDSIKGRFAIIEKTATTEPKAADTGTWTATPIAIP